ncbi:MAG: family transcriptional regulator [Rhodospirillales bacterium]|jgi:transcriptional regulator with XRE-family HTH domain|nr:family transcriptional regulator [Rhodospirillales bacterium]
MATDMRALVGINLLRLRHRRKLTQDQLSERTGFTQAYISSLERGRRNPTILTLQALGSALKADVVEFFERHASNS